MGGRSWNGVCSWSWVYGCQIGFVGCTGVGSMSRRYVGAVPLIILNMRVSLWNSRRCFRGSHLTSSNRAVVLHLAIAPLASLAAFF